MSSSNVILLRESRPQDGKVDPYEESFRESGFNVLSVPVLETTFTNLTELKSLIREGPFEKTNDLIGVIITSARSSEAWKTCVEQLQQDDSSDDPPEVGGWDRIPFYVVGKTTSSTLLRMARSKFAPDPANIRGEDTGTSEKLANFILDDIREHEGTKKLLYLTGDKNRETLPEILHAGGVSLRSLQVYRTQGSSSFQRDLQITLSTFPKGAGRWWIVFFAPSAAEYALPYLNSHFSFTPELQGSRRSDQLTHQPAQIASIGPTTTAFFQQQLKLRVDVTSPKPNAQALVSAIVLWQQEHDHV